ECKRRKIKCDRSQPCTPCTRRGEEAGCQWHIVEPVEKYATKAEFDDLKARFDQLAALVQRLLPTAPTATMPYYSMGVQPAMTGVISSEAVPGYNPGASSSITNVYSSMMPPPQPPPSQPYSQLLDTSSSSNRYTRPEEATSSSSTRPVHQSSMGSAASTSSPILSTALHSPSLGRRRALAGDITASSSAVRSSPLSLASITSPYLPDPQQHQQHQPHSQMQSQPKNYHAQTLILGRRLRHGSEGLVISPVRHRRRCLLIVLYRRRVLPHLRLQLLVLQPHFIFNKRGHPVG
ncbi:hypothetical protein BYT27DRAFT_7272463, partial [Phlegmacium glaucopus]